MTSRRKGAVRTAPADAALDGGAPKRAPRPERVAEQIQQELAMVMLTEMEDKRVRNATVSSVRLSPDLRQARVKVSAIGTDAERAMVIKGLTHAAGFLQAQLGSRLALRNVPRLKFELDRSIEYSVHIQSLLSSDQAQGGPLNRRAAAAKEPS